MAAWNWKIGSSTNVINMIVRNNFGSQISNKGKEWCWRRHVGIHSELGLEFLDACFYSWKSRPSFNIQINSLNNLAMMRQKEMSILQAKFWGWISKMECWIPAAVKATDCT